MTSRDLGNLGSYIVKTDDKVSSAKECGVVIPPSYHRSIVQQVVPLSVGLVCVLSVVSRQSQRQRSFVYAIVNFVVSSKPHYKVELFRLAILKQRVFVLTYPLSSPVASRSLSVVSRTGYRLFSLTSVDRVDEIFCSHDEDTKIAERLFSSSLVAVVTASEPNKLKV